MILVQKLASPVLGAIGTIILFISTYSIQSLEGSPFGGPELSKHNDRIRAENAKSRVWQMIGLAFLCASFLVQIAMIFPWRNPS